jgi:hypothetical protein
MNAGLELGFIVQVLFGILTMQKYGGTDWVNIR